jgi:hypothetical protein
MEEKRMIIAGFKCPICGSNVKAHGFIWRCVNRERCSFSMGRKWKSDPRGERWHPDPRYYESSKKRYQKKIVSDVEDIIFNLNFLTRTRNYIDFMGWHRTEIVPVYFEVIKDGQT